MRKIKKILILSSVFMLYIGCQRQVYHEEQNNNTIYFRLAENQPSDHPTVLADKKFARLVEEKTNGRIVIEVYDNEQLGSETEVLEQIQFGGIDFARVSVGIVAEISPQLNVLLLPYIYKDGDHMWRVLNSEIGDYFLNSIEDKKMIGLTWYDGGARNFYNSVKEIKKLSDLKGLRFRVMESQLMIDMAKALGAEVSPMPYNEVYSAIQQGMIDGAENNYPSYDATFHYEVAKYYTVNEHVRIPEILVASEKIKDRISEEDIEIIKDCAKQSQIYQREKWAEKEKESEKKLKEKGVIITHIKNREEFAEAVTPLYDEYAGKYKVIIKELQEME